MSATDPKTPITSTSECCCGPDCCGGNRGSDRSNAAPVAAKGVAADSTAVPPDADRVREQVREGYSAIARTGTWSSVQSSVGEQSVGREAAATSGCCGGSGASRGGGCCGPTTISAEALASAIGYSAAELASSPAEANLGLSCGNPTALASLKPGEVVLDLGAGGGFDCFIAGRRVGPTGRVIGVDMTPDMLTRARRNMATYSAQTGLSNVEFRLGEIEHLPVADGSVDVVISNCVLNLSPDKAQVWREIARVLKPGGRVAVSDLALLRPLPEPVRADVEALVGCVAGAVLVEETRRMAEAAGLGQLELICRPEYIEAMTNWEDPLYRRIVEALPAGTRPSAFITSLEVTARR